MESGVDNSPVIKRTLRGEFNFLQSRATKLDADGRSTVGFDLTDTTYTEPDHLKMVVKATMKNDSAGVVLYVETTLGEKVYHRITLTDTEIKEVMRRSKKDGIKETTRRYDWKTKVMTVNGDEQHELSENRGLIARAFEAVKTSNRLLDIQMRASQ